MVLVGLGAAGRAGKASEELPTLLALLEGPTRDGAAVARVLAAAAEDDDDDDHGV